MAEAVHPWLLLLSGLVKVMTANARALKAIKPKATQYCANSEGLAMPDLY